MSAAQAVSPAPGCPLAEVQVVVKRAAIDEAEAQVRAAQDRLRQAEADLANTAIAAPFDAVIDSKRVDLGQYVQAGSALMRLLGTSSVEVRLPLLASDVPFVRYGQAPDGSWSQAELSARFGDVTRSWTARLVRLEQRVDEQTGSSTWSPRSRRPTTRPATPGPYPLASSSKRESRVARYPARSLSRARHCTVAIRCISSNRAVCTSGRCRCGAEQDGVIVGEGLASGDRVIVTPGHDGRGHAGGRGALDAGARYRRLDGGQTRCRQPAHAGDHSRWAGVRGQHHQGGLSHLSSGRPSPSPCALSAVRRKRWKRVSCARSRNPSRISSVSRRSAPRRWRVGRGYRAARAGHAHGQGPGPGQSEGGRNRLVPLNAEEPIVDEVLTRIRAMRLTLYGALEEAQLRNWRSSCAMKCWRYPASPRCPSAVNQLRNIHRGVGLGAASLRPGLCRCGAAVQARSRDLPGGKLRTDAGSIVLRSVGQAYSGDEFADLTLITATTAPASPWAMWPG